MKNYEEIKKIIVEEYGYSNLEEYLKEVESKKSRTVPLSFQEIEALSPDNINNNDFWRVADELFGSDPVCNKQGGSQNIFESNIQNHRMALMSGVIGWLEAILIKIPTANVLEIGPGYGSFKNFLEVRYPNRNYFGVDARLRISDVVQTTPQGFIPEELLAKSKGTMDVVYSSNVFQHLSANQRIKYFKDTFDLLKTQGSFLVNLWCSTRELIKIGNFDSNGRNYVQHYGQYTIIPNPDEIMELSKSVGFECLSINQNLFSSLYSFFFYKNDSKRS